MNVPQVLETEISSSHIYLQQDPSVLVGNVANLSSQDSISADLLPSGNHGGVNLECFPSHSGNINFYPNHYRHHTLSIPSGAPSTCFLHNASNKPHIIHTDANSICYPLNSGDLASSSSTGVGGVGVHHYASSNDFIDTSRGSCKRKSDEAPVGNSYPVTASTRSSSVGACTNLYQPQPEDPSRSVGGVCDSLSLVQSEHRDSNNISASGGSQRSVRSRSGRVTMGTNRTIPLNNQFLQGNQIEQCPPMAGSDGTLTRFSNHSDGNSSNWSCFPVSFGSHRTLPSTGPSANGGPTDVGNVLTPAYPPVFGRIPAVIWHASPLHHLHPQAMQPIIYGHVPAPLNREAMTSRFYQNIQNRPHDGMQLGPARYFQVVPMQQGGGRSSRSQRRFSYEQAPRLTRNNNLMHLAMLSSQNFAMLDFSGFYDSGAYVDEYRNMRLDIDNMSYEELLALEERIGDVKTGLSEESISKCLKTKKHISSTCSSTCNNCENNKIETETCIICQEEYKAEEEIGSLDCGHEFHAECVTQWLLIKNLCPICKTHPLTADEK